MVWGCIKQNDQASLLDPRSKWVMDPMALTPMATILGPVGKVKSCCFEGLQWASTGVYVHSNGVKGVSRGFKAASAIFDVDPLTYHVQYFLLGCLHTVAVYNRATIKVLMYLLSIIVSNCYPKAQNGPKALYNMVFRPKSLRLLSGGSTQLLPLCAQILGGG